MAKPPLDGVRVLDLTWSLAGPQSARYLADLGAEVVKLESASRIDNLRLGYSNKDQVPGVNRATLFHNANAGKHSICVDLKEPAGMDVALRLAAGSDVVLESFAAGVIDKMGLGYERLSQDRAGLIMVSSSVHGATGLGAKGLPGIGTMGAALSGAAHLVGWPDRAPCGVHAAWTDSVAPKFVALAVLAALWRRDRTGEGCYIDVSQAETGVQMLRPAHYDYAVHGVTPVRGRGAMVELRSPSGIYPCTGNDRWVAIDVVESTQWEALRAEVGGRLLEKRFDTLVGRLRARESLDEAIAGWTETLTNDACEATLQAIGVPAHGVAHADDLACDPELIGCGQLVQVPDPEIGEIAVEAPRYRLSRTPLREPSRGPHLGEHGSQVLAELCGMSPSEIEACVSSGGVQLVGSEP